MHDELRRLDDELAAGRLDADTYRRRRDDLLATRPPEPVTPEPVTPEPVTPEPGRTGAAVSRDPFPPPFSWSAGAAANGHVVRDDAVPDATQVVAASPVRAGELVTERTQVVPGPRVGGGPASTNGVADTTQVVERPRIRAAEPARRSTRPSTPPPLPPPPARVAPPSPERTQLVPGAGVRAGDDRAVPADATVPPWSASRSTGLPGGRVEGRALFARGPGPTASTVVGTAVLVLVVAAVLVLSFVLG